MVQFNKPDSLNGAQLKKELNAAGVKIDYGVDSLSIDGDGILFLDIKSNDEAKAAAVIAAHIGVDTSNDKAAAKQSAQAKLAALGLTEEEVASILG